MVLVSDTKNKFWRRPPYKSDENDIFQIFKIFVLGSLNSTKIKTDTIFQHKILVLVLDTKNNFRPYKSDQNDMHAMFRNFVLGSLTSTKIRTGTIRQHIISLVYSELGTSAQKKGGPTTYTSFFIYV